MILVAGATGTVGGAVIEALKAMTPAPRFRALTRRPEAAERLKADGVESVVGDLADPASMRPALEGVERLFLTVSPQEGQVAVESAAADAARAAGVSQVVKLSAIGASPAEECAFLRFHGEIEGHIAASGVPYVFLRPNGFYQNFFGNAGTIRAQGALYAPAGDAAISFVDAADIGAVAARVLTEPTARHAGRSYDITGPESLTHGDVAARFSERLGREIRYVPADDDATRQTLAGFGVPPWQVEAVLALYRFYREGKGARVSAAVPEITGRPARSFAEFLADHAAAFGG